MSFKKHLELAHRYWKETVAKDDAAIDATCGNGNDTLVLASLAKVVHAIDIQPAALEKSRERLSRLPNVIFYEQCHSRLPPIAPVKLIVYNLGYLPGGNKEITTLVETTLQSLSQALELIAPNGLISVMCYPGHQEGMREECAILSWAEKLDPHKWSCCHHRWVNRERHPSLLCIRSSGASSQP